MEWMLCWSVVYRQDLQSFVGYFSVIGPKKPLLKETRAATRAEGNDHLKLDE